MLTRRNRLTSSRVFGEVVRRGRKAGTRTMVLHLSTAGEHADARRQVGFVVSKAVGPAVTRNLVKRRLRHHCRERLEALPDPVALVVRALPAAASADYAELSADFDRALARILGGSPARGAQSPRGMTR